MIEGREVIYVTDHRPLVHMFKTKKRVGFREGAGIFNIYSSFQIL